MTSSALQAHPIDMTVGPDLRRSRLTMFFRLSLVIPAAILTYVFRLLNEVVAFLGSFYCLFTGQMHEGMQNISTWLLRYELQTAAYSLLLTQRYPSLGGGPTL